LIINYTYNTEFTVSVTRPSTAAATGGGGNAVAKRLSSSVIRRLPLRRAASSGNDGKCTKKEKGRGKGEGEEQPKIYNHFGSAYFSNLPVDPADWQTETAAAFNSHFNRVYP
jgi:hypothetical protein